MKNKTLYLLILILGLISAGSGYAGNLLIPIKAGDHTIIIPLGTSSFKTAHASYAVNETVSVIITKALSGDEDWVGIYHKNADSTWGNVVAWNWVAKGTTPLNIVRKDMPAGEYEVRLFFHNSFTVEAQSGFTVTNVGPVDYGAYGSYDVAGPEKPDGEYIYIYKPEKNGQARINAPVVIYLSGGFAKFDSSLLSTQEQFMKYLASKGYVVIGVRTELEEGPEFQRILTALNQLGNLADTSKIGLMGSSTGGGRMFYVLRRLKWEENYAATSFLVSLDGYVALGERTDNVRNLTTSTLLLQFGGVDGLDYNGQDNGASGGIDRKEERYQDPRILMALYNILPGNEKSLSFLDNHTHAYAYGSMNGKEDMLTVVGAMLAYKFEDGGQNAKDVALNNNKYNEIDANKMAEDKYRYKCDEYAYDYCDVNKPTQDF